MKRLLILLASLCVFFILSLPLHELGHHIAAWCFGAGGTITINWLEYSGFYAPGLGLTDGQWQIVGLAGGGFVALIMGLVLIATRNLYARIGAILNTGLHLYICHAIGEGLYYI